MVMSSRIQRISCDTGLADDFPALDVGIESGNRWAGVRVQTMFGTGPGELAESYLPRHVLTVGSSRRFGVRWLGGPTVEESKQSPPDTVCIFPAMQPYLASWDSTSRSIFVELAPELVDEARRRSGSARQVELRAGPAANDQFIPPLAEALVDLAGRKDASTTLLAESLALTLATHLAQNHSTSALRPVKIRGAMAPSKVRLLEQFIGARLDREISLADLASLAEMSLFHFARCFKQSTGVAPHQYVTRRRIERARQLLANPELGVADVALRCGFSHQSHFSETFRRVVGTTPRLYRAALAGPRSRGARI
jgi:AraC family transcriptional regulator